MKTTLLIACMFVLLGMSSALAQKSTQPAPTKSEEKITYTTIGETIPGTLTAKPFTEIYPLVERIAGQTVLVSGIVYTYCSLNCWITFGDAANKVRVFTKLTGLPTGLEGRTIQLYGRFEVTPELKYRFIAISVRY